MGPSEVLHDLPPELLVRSLRTIPLNNQDPGVFVVREIEALGGHPKPAINRHLKPGN